MPALFLAAARPRSLKPPRHKARVPALCESNDLPRQPTAPRNAAPKAKVRRGSQPPRFNDRRLPTAPTPRDPPRRRSKPPRSTTDPPRRVLELPRSTTDPPRSPSKVPRSLPVLPRRVLDLPRSGFALPRFAAELGFAFPHPTGLFIPLAAFCRDAWFRALVLWGCLPRSPPLPPIRASLGPARFTRVANATPSPPSPPNCRGTRFRVSSFDRAVYPGRTAQVQPDIVHYFCRANNNRPRRPASCCRPWSCPASVPIAGNDSRRQARIAEAEGVGRARRRPRRTRGWLCAELSPPHWIRGRRPPQGGKPNAADSGQTRLAPNRRARFWAAQADRVAPVIRGESVGWREARTNADEHTLKGDPRPMAQARATLRTSKAQANRARGWEVPEAAVGETQRTTPTPTRGTRQSHRWDKQGTNQRQRRRAAPKSNGNSATELGRASHSLLGADRGRIEPLLRGESKPKTPHRRANGFVGTNTGTILAQWRGGAGANPLSLGNARFARAVGVGLPDRREPRRGRKRPSPAPEEIGTSHPPRLAPRQRRERDEPPASHPNTHDNCFRILQPPLQPLLFAMAAFAYPPIAKQLPVGVATRGAGPGVGSRL